MLKPAYIPDSKWNDTVWRTGPVADRFNSIVEQARSKTDTTKSRAMYYEAQALVNDDGGALIPMFANYIHGVNNEDWS